MPLVFYPLKWVQRKAMVTYQTQEVDMSTDRPAHEAEREIEVTPEMIEAGVSEMYDDDRIVINHVVVEAIYKAMVRARARELVISPTMMAIGEEVILSEIGDLGGHFAASALAEKVFLAMVAAH